MAELTNRQAREVACGCVAVYRHCRGWWTVARKQPPERPHSSAMSARWVPVCGACAEAGLDREPG